MPIVLRNMYEQVLRDIRSHRQAIYFSCDFYVIAEEEKDGPDKLNGESRQKDLVAGQ